eukprot:6218334-Prymnesium_polylepis.1
MAWDPNVAGVVASRDVPCTATPTATVLPTPQPRESAQSRWALPLRGCGSLVPYPRPILSHVKPTHTAKRDGLPLALSNGQTGRPQESSSCSVMNEDNSTELRFVEPPANATESRLTIVDARVDVRRGGADCGGCGVSGPLIRALMMRTGTKEDSISAGWAC